LLDLREKFGERLLVGDGAVGTLLGDRGIAKPHTKANLTHPQIVQELHEEYLRAGSSVIETNTFGANRLKLATHGLEEQVREINVEGARLALEATKTVTGSNGSQALVMGSDRATRQASRSDRLYSARRSEGHFRRAGRGAT
jgi:homocysteine S-methyltransferase